MKKTNPETSSASPKTTWKQRLAAGIVAALLLFSSVAIYIAVIFGKNSSSSSVNDELVAELEKSYTEKTTEYTKKNEEFENSTQSVRNDNLEKMIALRSEVKAYNSASANEGLNIKDLKIGSGEALTDTSTGYGIFYIGWCSNETVFDSSLDSFDSPSKLKAPLPVTSTDQLVQGMYKGINGMHIGGTRIITIPGELAYGETREDICDGKNSPLKFAVRAVSLSDDSLKLAEELNTLSLELSALYTKYLYASYGIEMGE